jgi:hypothetical protein
VTIPREPQSLMEAVFIQPAPHPYFHSINPQRQESIDFLPSSIVGDSESSSISYWQDSPSTANSAYGSEPNVSGANTPAATSASSTMPYGDAYSEYWPGQQPSQNPAQSMFGDSTLHPYTAQEFGMRHLDYGQITPFCAPTWNTLDDAHNSNVSISTAPGHSTSGQ